MTLIFLEVILTIVMAIATTICLYLSLVLHQKKYAHHVVFDQPTKSQKRILEHPYFYFLTMLLFIMSYTWVLANYVTGNVQQFCFGLIISLFSILFGHAAGGILIFLYTIKNPEKVSGQAIFKDKKFLALHLQKTLMPCLTLLIALAIIHHTPFILGSLAAATIISLSPLVQVLKH